jgi:hypothetical protein
LPRFHFSGKSVYEHLAVGSARISPPRALVAHSLYRGQENRALLMRQKSKSEVEC